MSAKPKINLTTTDLADILAAHKPVEHYWVGYSGGLDSHVLLHLLAQLQSENKISLKAVHVNHGLNQDADAWASHCQNSCDQLSVELISIKVDATANPGESPEAAARRARYAAFETVLLPDSCK